MRKFEIGRNDRSIMNRKRIAGAIVAGAVCAAMVLPATASATYSRYWVTVVGGTCAADYGYVNNNVEVDKGNYALNRTLSVVTGKLYSYWRVGFKYANGTQAYSVVGPLNTQSASKSNDYPSSSSNPFIRNVTGGGYYESSACFQY